MAYKLNFNHKRVAVVPKVRGIAGDTSVLLSGGESSSRAVFQSSVPDKLVLQVKLAVDQLERHQTRATRENRELTNMTREEGWEKLESLEQCEWERNETPVHLSRCLRSFHGRVGASRVLKRHFLN